LKAACTGASGGDRRAIAAGAGAKVEISAPAGGGLFFGFTCEHTHDLPRFSSAGMSPLFVMADIMIFGLLGYRKLT
jgi:hypothetical protein